MKQTRLRGKGALPGLLFLSLFFLVGILGGQIMAARVSGEIWDELDRYLQSFVVLEHEPVSLRVILSTLLLYLRYPLLAFFLGFASVGVALLPCLAVAFGFFLSFSVSCFTAAFGSGGVLIALAVSGLRCAVTLPCFFLLGIPALRTSAALASLSFGRGRRVLPMAFGKDFWIRLAVCAAVLLAAACTDLLVSPVFLDLALNRILT